MKGCHKLILSKVERKLKKERMPQIDSFKG
jgi:hypothetical protein